MRSDCREPVFNVVNAEGIGNGVSIERSGLYALESPTTGRARPLLSDFPCRCQAAQPRTCTYAGQSVEWPTDLPFRYHRFAIMTA